MSITYKLNDLSFPDSVVVEMRVDHAAKRVLLEMTGAWTATASLGSGEFIIYGWETLRQRRYDMAQKIWIDILFGQEESLKDIAELIVDHNQIVISGFGAVTGEWIELIAIGGRGEYRTQE